MKFGLTQKGLILVGVPFVFELVLFGGMLFALDQTEKIAQRAMHSRQVVEAIDQATSDLVGLYQIGNKLGPSSPKEMANPIWHQFDLIDSDVKRTKELLKDSPKDKAWVQPLEETVAQSRECMTKLAQAYERQDYAALAQDVMIGKTFWKRALLDSSKWRMTGLTHEHQAIQEQELAQQAEYRARTGVILKIALALSVIINLCMVLFFGRQIARRVAVITDNNRRLAEEKPLHEPVPGSDEISDLDNAFHEMAKSLSASRESERQAHQLRNQVVAMVTHDLRSPLSTVSTFLEFLETENLSPQTDELLVLASQSAAQMARLVNDLLDLDRLESGMMLLDESEFAVSQAIEQVQAAVSGFLSQKHISLKTSGDARVYADEHRLVQILTNLVTNAIKFSPDRADVFIEVKQKEKVVRIAVTDQGRGIPEDKIEHIFEAFKQVLPSDSKALGGSGLGLAICKALVELHGGAIGVETRQGKGSTFWFTIPTS